MASRSRTRGTRTNPGGRYLRRYTYGNPTGFQPGGSPSISSLPGDLLQEIPYQPGDDNRETISDVVGDITGFHPCTHESVREVFSPPPRVTYVLRDAQTPPGRKRVEFEDTTLHLYVRDSANGWPEASVGNASGVALNRVKGVSSELMSGLVSIYELKDVYGTLVDIASHLLWARARYRKGGPIGLALAEFSQLRKLARNPGLLMKKLVGLHLEWKFGVKPLIKDINTVSSVMGWLDARVSKMASQTFTFKGRASADGSNSTTYVEGNDSSIPCYKSIVVRRSTKKTWVYGVRKRIKPNLLPKPDALRWMAIRDSLGLTLDATDLWEVVPYSFVVDWFLPIQDMLESMGSRPPDPTWLETVGAWSSLKSTTTYSGSELLGPYRKINQNFVVEEGKDVVFYQEISRTLYTRTLLSALPNNYDVPIYIPRLKVPNRDQWVTGIELVFQRIMSSFK